MLGRALKVLPLGGRVATSLNVSGHALFPFDFDNVEAAIYGVCDEFKATIYNHPDGFEVVYTDPSGRVLDQQILDGPDYVLKLPDVSSHLQKLWVGSQLQGLR